MPFEDRPRWFTPPGYQPNDPGIVPAQFLPPGAAQWRSPEERAADWVPQFGGPRRGGFGTVSGAEIADRQVQRLLGRAQRKKALESIQGSPLDPYVKNLQQRQAEVAAKVSEAIGQDEEAAKNSRRDLVQSWMAGGFGRMPMPMDVVNHYARALDIADANMSALRLKAALTGQEQEVTGGQPIVKDGGLNSVQDFVDVLKNGGGADLDYYALSIDQRKQLRDAIPIAAALQQQKKKGEF